MWVGRNSEDHICGAQRREKALSPGPHWHVVHTEARRDDVARQMIEARGFAVYQPLCRHLVAPPRKHLSRAQRAHVHLLRREVLRPLFPRYLFVRFDAEADPWHDLFRVVGVRGIICAGDAPYPIEDRVVEALREREIGEAIPLGMPVRELACALGDPVRVTDGPLAGLRGMVEDLDDHGRVLLLMSLFGRKVRVTMSCEHVERT